MKTTAWIALAFLGLNAPAHAAQDCPAAIRAARQAPMNLDSPVNVPNACWRLGPLTLGMTRKAVEAVLGPADATAPAKGLWQGRAFTVPMVVYVYPRRLMARQASMPTFEGHPVALKLVYDQNRLVAISELTLGGNFEPCGASRTASHPVPEVFPFDFFGINLGTPGSKVIAAFGSAPDINRGRDFWRYTPVPLSFHVEDTVQDMNFATSFRFNELDGQFTFSMDRDADTCRVRDFKIAPYYMSVFAR